MIVWPLRHDCERREGDSLKNASARCDRGVGDQDHAKHAKTIAARMRFSASSSLEHS